MGMPPTSSDPFCITRTLLPCRTLADFDRVLGKELVAALGCDVVGLYLYSESTGAFSPISKPLLDPSSPGYLIGQLPAAGTLKEATIREGQALVEHDVGQSAWAEASALVHSPFQTASALTLPMTVPPSAEHPHPRIIAVAGAIAVDRPHAFSEDDRHFVDSLGAQLGPVLEAILASEERDALMAINSRVVVGAMTLEALMPVVQEMLRRVVRQDMTGLVRFVQSADGPWFDIVYRDGVQIDLAQLRAFPFERMAPGEMLATGKPLLITGHNHERFPERAYIESVGIRSCVLCPLSVCGTPYGFLAIGSHRRNAFSDRDLAFAEQISFHLSQAITNLTAYDEIRQLKDQLEQENLFLREEMTASMDVSSLVGESPALQKALKAVEQVAPTDSTVLITGETGTGKELVAQAVHQLSTRKDRPLITVNCAALPPSLIESELFGHEKGAFTHATARKLGRFELAAGGTIFLDEVGELPVELQAKLLRVLEGREFERVGGTQTLKLDIRVLAATNVDVDQAIAQGRLRSDLYYRLNVFPIRMPPLRERREDIPVLARHFAKKHAERHRKSISRIASSTLKALAAYDWPGNVRELEHVIERAVIVSQGSLLTVEEFGRTHCTQQRSDGHRTLADAERAHILDTLSQTNWVLAGKHGAAARLGMKRSTLQHRMKKLGIRRIKT
ncbi:hypothetical protein YTPLAS18_26650 [Nitrospira sp.]|nr:hypothetical protein YTPLAS18_26650 [Nitrospira sp.]